MFEFIGLSLLVCGFVLCSDFKISYRSLIIILLAPAALVVGSASYVLVAEQTAPTNWASDIKHTLSSGSGFKISAEPYRYSPAKLLSCIQAIRGRHMHELKDVFTNPAHTAHPILLVDPAQHNNVGDVLIVEGEKALAIEFGWGERNIHECCVQQARSGPACKAAVRNGSYRLAMWHGGGNWGDLYYGVQLGRIASLRYLLDAGMAVVGMPQSFHYRNQAAQQADLRQLQALANSSAGSETRKKLVLLWRQRDSFESALGLYGFADNRLVPDIAFWAGPFLHQGSAAALDDSRHVDILLLLRHDGESTQRKGAWSQERVRATLDHVAVQRGFGPGPPGRNVSFRIADWKSIRILRGVRDSAEYRIKISAAVRLLGSATVVVTDRLHATILSLLAIKPVFYVDQSYGKIRHTLDVAFSSSPDCGDAESMRVFRVGNLSEALARSAAFLERCRRGSGC